MIAGEVKAVAAYQGSGQKGSTSQSTKVSYEAKAADTVEISSMQGTPARKDMAGREVSSNKSVKNAVQELNKKLMNSEAVYGIHEDTNRVTIKIVDRSTREVLREYPPEETLDMIAKAWELAGLTVDDKR